jgi:hypothetical protein
MDPRTSRPGGAEDPDRPRLSALMAAALDAAVASLPARDRLLLGCYYEQQLTLAQIGRLLGEHEATISRHLARARRTIREAVERHLRELDGLDEAACRECFAMVLEDPGTLDLRELLRPAESATAMGAGPSTSLRAGRPGKNRDLDRSN